MFLSDFDYDLPDELIATLSRRGATDSRLLVVGETLEDRQFRDLPTFLESR